MRASWPPLSSRARRPPQSTPDKPLPRAGTPARKLRDSGRTPAAVACLAHAPDTPCRAQIIRPAPEWVSGSGGLAVIKSPIGRRARLRGIAAPDGGRSPRRGGLQQQQEQQQRAGRDAGKRRHAVSGRHWHGLRGRGGANAAVAGDDLREAWVREKAGPNRVMSWCKTRIWQAA